MCLFRDLRHASRRQSYPKSSVCPECCCSPSHCSRTTRSYLAGFGQLHWLPVQRRVDYKLACFVFSSLSGQALRYLRTLLTTYIWSPKIIDGGYALQLTDRVPFHAHTTRSATGASLSPGLVFVWPTCAMRTLHHSFRRELKTFLL